MASTIVHRTARYRLLVTLELPTTFARTTAANFSRLATQSGVQAFEAVSFSAHRSE